MVAVYIDGQPILDVFGSQLAELLGVSPWQVARWRKEGMPAKRGGVTVYDVKVCMYWVAGRSMAYRAGIRDEFPPVATTMLGYLVHVGADTKNPSDWLPAARAIGRRAGGSPELVERLLSAPWLYRKNPITSPNQKENQP